MTQPQSHLEPLSDAPRRPRAWPWWTVLVLLCSVIFGMHFVDKEIPTTLPDPGTTDSPILKLYGRYMMGADQLMRSIAPPTSAAPSPFESPEALKSLDDASPTIIERIRVVPIAGELIGPEAALARLDAIDAELAADPSIDEGFRRDTATLRALYTDRGASLEQLDRTELLQRHHWFGRLALSFGKPDTDPFRAIFAEQASRTMSAIVAFGVLLVVAVISGFVLFIIGAILGASGSIKPAFHSPGSSLAAPLPATNSFLESFVLFLASFLVATLVAGIIHVLTGLDASYVVVWVIPILALWPLSRGLSWPQLRASIGWHRGRGVLREVGAGILGYLAGIPVIVLGMALSLVIISLSGTDASHPIVNNVAAGGLFSILGLFLMTTVWAPLVEESFFRGAFYAHLRGLPRVPTSALASRSPIVEGAEPAAPTPLRRGLSVLPAALIVGFVFAIIHPQGFGGVPVLTALGFNFCILREWRGSLIAPMVAHAMHNGVATLALVMFLA